MEDVSKKTTPLYAHVTLDTREETVTKVKKFLSVNLLKKVKVFILCFFSNLDSDSAYFFASKQKIHQYRYGELLTHGSRCDPLVEIQ